MGLSPEARNVALDRMPINLLEAPHIREMPTMPYPLKPEIDGRSYIYQEKLRTKSLLQ